MNMNSFLLLWAGLLLAAGCNSGHKNSAKEAAKIESIQGGQWRLSMLEGLDVPADAVITLDLLPDKKLAGSTGVNQYFGTYIADTPGFIRFSPLGMTRRAGPPDAMKREAQFVGAMERITEFHSEAGSLKMTDGQSTLLVWRR